MDTFRSGLIVFIGAEKREFDGLLAKVNGAIKIHWPLDFARSAVWHGEPALFVANGPGPKLAAEAVQVVSNRQPVAAWVSIGFCGGLDPALQAGDIFVASEVLGVGPALPPPGARKAHKIGRLVSTDRVAVTPREKLDLRRIGADAVEMEAAPVAKNAQENRVPFYCVRVVTDTSEEELPLDFNHMRGSDGRFSRAKILAAACRKPGVVFPELMRLNQRTKSAAVALGDFIADCRF
jgi:adenosylhomocysteine nucleosidase